MHCNDKHKIDELRILLMPHLIYYVPNFIKISHKKTCYLFTHMLNLGNYWTNFDTYNYLLTWLIVLSCETITAVSSILCCSVGSEL